MFEDLSEALSIKFSHSQDESFEMLSSPEKDKQHFKVKCFKCYGTHQNNCQECHGTQMVNVSHPLAKLLDKVLTRKLGLLRAEQQKQEELERVCPIKEEEEDSEQKRTNCKYCYKEIQYICVEGSESLLERICQECTVSLTHVQQNFLSESAQHHSLLKLCKNCDREIENCYSICKTCQQKGGQYWICDECSDNQKYYHDVSHQIEPVISFQPLQRRVSMVSQIFIQEERTSIQNFQDFVFDRQLGHPILSMGNSVQLNNNPLERSSVKFQVEGLFNSHHFQDDLRSTVLRNYNRKSMNEVARKVKFCQQAEHKENVEQQISNKGDYFFIDYKCDKCEAEPIINIRYHCNLCQDFDLCQKCYKTTDLSHPHDSFEQIDGRLIKQKAVEKIFQTRLSTLNLAQSSRNKKMAHFETFRQLYGTCIRNTLIK